MPFKTITMSVALAALFAGPVLAQPADQNASPVCNHTAGNIAHAPLDNTNSTGSMADTSSGGVTGTGASSAAIGTGPTDKTGDNSPCAPGLAGHTTGALPNSTPNTP